MTSEQEALFQLLLQFDEICQKHHLRYWLAGGTLLGAVRHKGFIPWDDDIDVMMPARDYQKFLSLRAVLPEKLVLLEERIHAGYPFYFCELCNTEIPFDSGYPNGPQGIYLDIFPLFPSRRPDRLACFCFNAICLVSYVLQVKMDWTVYTPYKKRYARWLFAILRHCPVALLRAMRRQLIQSLRRKDSQYYCSPGGGHKGLVEFYPVEWLENTVWLPFETGSFPAPAAWDDYLRQLYGEYMVLPDMEYRKSEHKAKG